MGCVRTDKAVEKNYGNCTILVCFIRLDHVELLGTLEFELGTLVFELKTLEFELRRPTFLDNTN